MEMRKAIGIILVIFLASGPGANGQLKVPGLEKFKDVMGNCTMEYTMKCEYPGGQVFDIKGKIAVQGSNFYDSSNLRYVFLNNDWYIIADHMLKELSVAYVHDINKELEGIATISASSFLFSENSFADISGIEVIKQNEDTSWLNVKFRDTTVIRELQVQTLRKNLQPVRYSAVINYPIGGYGISDVAAVRLTMDCFNIQTPADEALFDDRRLVTKSGKKITMKMFRTYKMYN